MACERITQGIVRNLLEGERPIKALLDLIQPGWVDEFTCASRRQSNCAGGPTPNRCHINWAGLRQRMGGATLLRSGIPSAGQSVRQEL